MKSEKAIRARYADVKRLDKPGPFFSGVIDALEWVLFDTEKNKPAAESPKEKP